MEENKNRMKNVFEKLFIMIVTLFMTFSLVGVNRVSADETITVNGDATITIYDGQVYLRKLDGTGADFSSAGITVYEGTIAGFDKGTTAVDTWTSDGTDHPFSNLVEHSAYTLVETTVPENYVQAKNVPFTATRAKQNFTMTDYQVEAVKMDTETYETKYENRPQGDAVLNDGKFQVLDASKNVVENPFGDDVYVLKENEFTFLQGLKEGQTYYLHEVTPPTGYLPNTEDLQFTADLVAGPAETAKFKTAVNENLDGAKDLIFKNEVITGTMSLHKTFNSHTGSSTFTTNEAGAEFTIILKKWVEKYREEGMTDLEAVQAAMEHTDEYTDKEWDVITTDDAGNASSRALAYGTYWVQQTNKTYPEAHMIKDHTEFTITANGSNKHFETVNEENRYTLRVNKLDAETGEPILRNSAGFTLYDEEGNQVVQKIGTDFWEFITNSVYGVEHQESRWLNDDDELGVVNTPDVLKPGKYTVKETVVPWGYLGAEVKIDVSENGIVQIDENDNSTFLQDILDQRVYGKLTINKQVEQWTESDVTRINHSDYSGIKFTITAAEDIQSPIYDGLELSPTGVELSEGAVYGVYSLNPDGTLVVEHIPLGKYTVQETAAPEGIIMDDTVYEIEFTQEDYETAVYEEEIAPVNLVTKVAISKQDVAGEELPGAHLMVKNSEGLIVDEWESTDTPHKIEGLVAGAKYTLEEDLAPVGYTKSGAIEFTVADDGSVTEVEMVDKVVYISKQDVAGDEVEGALVRILDENGIVVDEWISGIEKHKAENLVIGKTYTLHEETAPIGYVLVNDIEFTVENDGADQTVEMVDTVERVAKVDQDGNLLEGISLEVIDEDGYTVDNWVSGRHIVDLSDEDVADLDAGSAVVVDGMEIVPNMAQESGLLGLFGASYADGAVVIDRNSDPTAYYEIDLNGNETYHRVEGLVAGKKYTVVEVPPYGTGYYLAEDIDLAPNAEEDHYTEMVDNKINLVVLKVDDSGVELENAKMELYELDDEDKYQKIHEWTTVLEEEDISDLVTPGRIYKIVESETPAGHYQAMEYTFQVPFYGSSEKQIIYMVDIAGQVSFLKYDPVTGLPVKDAKYSVFELNEGVTEAQIKGKTVAQMKSAGLINVITTFVTVNDKEGQSYDINGKEIAKLLYEGRKYYIQEVEPPFGYDIDPEAHAFEMVGDRDAKQMMRVFDNPKILYIRVAKADSKDVKYMLAGAEITVYKADGKVAKTKDGKDAIGVTDKNGLVSFMLQFDQNQSYYAMETKAPKDYYLNRNKFEVKVSEDYTFFETDLIKVSVLDKGLIILPKIRELINTGGGMAAIGALAVLAVAACALVIVNRKKDKKEDAPAEEKAVEAPKAEDAPKEEVKEAKAEEKKPEEKKDKEKSE